MDIHSPLNTHLESQGQKVLALEIKENQVPTLTFATENPGYLREEKTKSNTKKPKMECVDVCNIPLERETKRTLDEMVSYFNEKLPIVWKI